MKINKTIGHDGVMYTYEATMTGADLREEMVKRGLRPKQFAAVISVSPPKLSHLFAGRYAIPELQVKIALAYFDGKVAGVFEERQRIAERLPEMIAKSAETTTA